MSPVPDVVIELRERFRSVYELYDLTAEEIAIVEGNTQGRTLCSPIFSGRSP